MANFKTRRAPRGDYSTRVASGVSLPEHLTEQNPHPQYILRSESLEDLIDIPEVSGKADQSDLNKLKQNIEGWQASHILASNDPHTQYITVNEIRTDESVQTAIKSLITQGAEVTNDPTAEDTTKAASGAYASNTRSMLDNHTAPQNQNATGVIGTHLDTSGNELYARRIHTHPLSIAKQRNSGSVCDLDFRDGELQIIKLSANCDLNVMNLDLGRTMTAIIDNEQGRMLTFGNVNILEPEDNGKYAIKFLRMNGTEVACIGLCKIVTSEVLKS